ncbi:MAG: nucleoside 2-deoxyribosyltransferase [Aquificales bacterium]|nr:nucleoside 2-deoxyribosyltransferase [Aquificales bacterium]
MKQAYLGIKFYADQSNRPLIEMITAALTQAGWTTQVIVRDLEQWGVAQFEPQMLMARTFAVIEVSDIAVIDLTEKGVGLGIEAGYAFAKGIPVFTIAREGADISATLRGISQNIYHYKNEDDLVLYMQTLMV